VLIALKALLAGGAVLLMLVGRDVRAAVPPVIDAAMACALGDVATVTAAKHTAFDVISRAELRRAIDLEAQKQRAGCGAESTSYLVECAGAMGARFVAFGQAGHARHEDRADVEPVRPEERELVGARCRR